MTNLNCRDVEELILDYVGGVLAEGQRLQFELHLSDCPHCTVYLEAYRVSVTLAKAAFHEDKPFVPDRVPEELVEAVLATMKKGRQ